MPLLHIALEEGFTNEHVRIDVDGRMVFDKDGVRTRAQIGFADSVEVDPPAGTVVIDVAVSPRGQTAKVHAARESVAVLKPAYLSVSLGPGGVTCRVSDQPPRYA